MDAATEITEMEESSRLLDAVLVSGNVAAAARALDIPYNRARRLYKEQLQRYWSENADKAEMVAARELRKLDLIERPMMKAALNGDVKAVDRMLAISKARREILGIDSATRVQVEVGTVQSAIIDIAQMVDGSLAAAAPLRIAAVPEAS